ncbi:HupE/UreJ family protein [Marinomonas pontica]|uniref:HupE/UreJ family protein n=1 Tax=Marinomonas pontica TaxID=264739 RepID=UPI002243EECD|nr:HupE/UreJ family protein [Marinomonas pontica]MCW8355817.1 HupE/UreJ family protein [Marinomonas pontica]
MRLSTLKMGLAALVAAIPALALAHPGHEHTTSFMTGFMHPMGGLDHLLAMLAIGLWAASLGGRALWAVPAAFVGTMLVGGALAVAGVQVPFIEQGIVLSVILMGALLLGAARFSVVTCAGIAGLFAIFHGAAHGLEMPLNANGAEYALGFAVATALLHVVGIGFGAVIARFQAPIVTRVTGSVIAIAGLFLALA